MEMKEDTKITVFDQPEESEYKINITKMINGNPVGCVIVFDPSEHDPRIVAYNIIDGIEKYEVDLVKRMKKLGSE